MISWLLWCSRCIASFILVSMAAMLLMFALVGTQNTVATIATSLVLGIAGLATWPRIPNAWRRDPPTAKQLAYAEKLGLDVPARITKGELSDMISSVTGR